MTQQDFSRVPGRNHYSPRYLRGGRIFSYAHQLDTVMSFEPVTVLEIGAGAGVVTAALRAAGINVTTLDIQPELAPDITGSVTQIPCCDGAFDVALCCQVLEHLPFDMFVPALVDLRRVATQGLVLGLPDVSRRGYIAAKLPALPEFRIDWQLPVLRESSFPSSRFESMGHYWEVGYRGSSYEQVRTSIVASGWLIEKSWRVPELLWHRFYKLVQVKS